MPIEQDDNDVDYIPSKKMTTSESVKIGKMNRPAKSLKVASKPTESLEIFDKDDEPFMKIPKSEAAEGTEKRTSSTKESSQSESVMEGHNSNQKNQLPCPECEYHLSRVGSWVAHLKLKHSTTLVSYLFKYFFIGWMFPSM
ncbi:hypothetical protein PMAYCL1PPCAC_13992 [Pristionchus mayeri]|uniref:C2H2-type domain-containing protein n=1 Tax=Pristionchus mayeri TaxID=1317129 RepID=A0AAN4ZSY1_9BILA|nr:hypothetical protein PMAYCL1PPCAC_13992 [Pristionchus mayeri]